MIKKILNRPMTVITIFTLLTVLGLFMVFDLPVDLLPEMNPPIIVVQTVYPAAGPEEVEEDITEVLEDQLINLEGLKKITSTSAENVSSITLEFPWGKDIDDLETDVRQKVDQSVYLLPDDAESPIIWKFDPNSQAIVELSLLGQRSMDELNDISEEIIKPGIEQVSGVAKVDLTGARDTEVKVSVYQDRLAAYNLTVSQVARALSVQNLSLGAGSVTQGETDLLIRTTGKYDSLNQIADTIITSIQDGEQTQKVLVRDVADVFYGYEEETSRVLVNGQSGVSILVYKQTGTNTVQIAEDIKKTVEKIRKDLPVGVELKVLSDSSKVIEQSLSQVLTSAFLGIFCSIFILLLFLRQARSTLIVAISIPVSILITILGMRIGGKTFNIVALTGLTLGVGMIVDASIVILENIFKYREQGARIRAASLFGTQEMINPIVASILTTISVFLPIILFGGEIGQIGAMMNDMAFTVIVALISSLLVAIFLVPVLAGHFLPIHTRAEQPLKNKFLIVLDRKIESAMKSMEKGYQFILTHALKNKAMVIVTALVILIISFMQVPKLGLNFMPAQAAESITISAELPIGSSLDATKNMMDQLEFVVRKEIKGYKDISQSVGQNEKYSGSMTLVLPDLSEREQSVEEIKDDIRLLFPGFPDVKFTVSDAGGMSGPRSGGGEGDVNIKIKSPDQDKAFLYAEKVAKLLEESVPELTDIRMNTERGLPQVEIVVNRTRAYDLGLDSQTVAMEIKNQLAGTTATVLSKDGETFDVVVQIREEDRQSLPDLEKLFVVSPTKGRIPVSGFAKLERNSGPVSIMRDDQDRTVTVYGSLSKGANVNFAQTKAKEVIDREIAEEEGVSISFSGEMDDIAESGAGMVKILIFAILLVLGVMISQFQSLKAPFVIILAMPMMVVGIIGIYLITNVSFGMVSAIGVIMLSGIVVNNGIVLVDYTNLLRKRGEGLIEACIIGGVNRLRPILMTTLTTILTMVPLAFFTGEGGSIMQPLGLTVVGGLSVNMVTTLILVPVLYAVIFKEKTENKIKIPDAREAV